MTDLPDTETAYLFGSFVGPGVEPMECGHPIDAWDDGGEVCRWCAATARAEAAEAEVARLRRVLAVEGGDATAGLPEWRRNGPDRFCYIDGSMVARVRGGVWAWVSRGGPEDAEPRVGEAPTALEAMEAADAAWEVSGG